MTEEALKNRRRGEPTVKIRERQAVSVVYMAKGKKKN